MNISISFQRAVGFLIANTVIYFEIQASEWALLFSNLNSIAMNEILSSFERYIADTFQITILFIFSTFITIFIFKLLKKFVEKKSKALLIGDKDQYIQDFFAKSNIKEILQKIKIKFHFERTFIRYNTVL